MESVVVVDVPAYEFVNIPQQSRLRFTVKSQDRQIPAFEMIFSGFFGVRFLNYYASSSKDNSSKASAQEAYLDVDLDLQKVSDKIFLIFHDEKVFVTSGGLSFVDIIYVGDFIPD